MAGETVFASIGCANCHTPAFSTPDDPSLEGALRDRTLRPYSDFLLHDMGQAADFIEQGAAQPRELRTAPLWGLRVRDPVWHDGRVGGGTFADRMVAAIGEHDSVGSEAQASAQAFDALLQADKDDLVAFLGSLGRAEFDHDGDNDVDDLDYTSFQACFTGPGTFFTPDDPCSISDVDQDGDVDDDDFDLFLAAAEGEAGRVPDGLAVAGVPLSVESLGGDQVRLIWGASCSAGDIDYQVYSGTLGQFTGHTPDTCNTGGTTEHITSAPGSRYFLVVPANGFREGSYGTDSSGAPRSPGAAACLPQSHGACE